MFNLVKRGKDFMCNLICKKKNGLIGMINIRTLVSGTFFASTNFVLASGKIAKFFKNFY